MSKAIIFDFDGTLVDSEKAIYECFQKITKRIAPERESYAKNLLIGPPLRDTASEILGAEKQDLLDEFVQSFIAMHDEHVICHTQPYPDVTQVLNELYIKNIPMAVATNKRSAPTQKLIDNFGWSEYLLLIECSDSKLKIRNKDAMIKDIINQSSPFQASFFVGDTVNDGLSANLNQLPFVKASYGYGREQDWSKVNIYREIHQLIEILELI